MRRFDPVAIGYLGFLAVPGLLPAFRPLLVFSVCFLAWVWMGVNIVARGPSERGSWIQPAGGDRRPRRRALSTLGLFTNPYVWAHALSRIVGHIFLTLRYGGRLPAETDRADAPDYRLPVSGTWTIRRGGPTPAESHSWAVFGHRYAYDFVQTDADGKTHEDDGSELGDYICYGEPVLAPASGEVVGVKKRHRDMPRPGGWIDPFLRSPWGNHIRIKHGDEFSVIGHLRPGSIRVTEGDTVEAGQPLGQCGNSGSSDEPQIHFHVQDGALGFLSMGLPIAFADLLVGEGPDEPTRHEQDVVPHVGQRVRHPEDGRR